MKIFIAIAAIVSLSFLTPSAHAQSAKPMKRHHRMRSTMMQSSDSTTMMESNESSQSSPVGAEVSGITGAAPGDPYNLNHPYFQGDPRWSDADQLYMHGDFPWALVQQHPEAFRFNAETGKWEMLNTANLGS